jgi:peptidyl-tRNA hydrolase, PTH1 family
MKLIVGIGNPDKKYDFTRHNIGFSILDYYAKCYNVSFDKKKFNGLYAEFLVDGEKVLLLKPLSYVNLSGNVVKSYVDYFNIDVSDILIISDDLDMDFGKIRLRLSGSSGGHNGLRSIENCLGTKNYKRLKFGISNDKGMNTKDYVLGKISKFELEIFNSLLPFIVNILDDYLRIDFANLMNKYN